MILLSEIDSISLMVWEIYGSKVLTFAIYGDAIAKIVNLTPPYLSNHQEHWIDHGEKDYSEWKFEYNQRSELVFGMIWKSIFCHQGGKLDWNGSWADKCPRCRPQELPFWYQGWYLNGKHIQSFWTDVNERSLGSLIITGGFVKKIYQIPVFKILFT